MASAASAASGCTFVAHASSLWHKLSLSNEVKLTPAGTRKQPVHAYHWLMECDCSSRHGCPTSSEGAQGQFQYSREGLFPILVSC